MDIKQELGEKIKRLRKKRGYTQEQLAEMIDISSRNLSNIELGISFPKSETLEKILKSLSVTTQELFSNDHIKTNQELLDGISQYVSCVQKDTNTLELIYKIVKDIAEKI